MSADQFILSGPPDVENITDGTQSLGEFILHRISQWGDSICQVSSGICLKESAASYSLYIPISQIDGITSQEFTYAEIKSRSIRYAECLQNEGVGCGDVVGICSENRIDFTCALFGAIYLGATVAPLNLTYSECE